MRCVVEGGIIALNRFYGEEKNYQQKDWKNFWLLMVPLWRELTVCQLWVAIHYQGYFGQTVPEP